MIPFGVLLWPLLAQASINTTTGDPPDPWKPITALVSIIGGGGIIGIITLLVTKTAPWLRAKLESRSLEKRVGAELFTAANIERSLRYFVPPDCQSVDPAGGDEPKLVYAAREPLLNALDNALTHPTAYRYLFLLADSGMGKTTALLNYYVRHIRRWRRKFNLVLIPLGIPDADERIKKVENKESTVLFLDALDEDVLAIVDHADRLKILLDLTRDFSRVLITCRTQFFPKEEEIPQETGIIKVGARAAGEPAEYVFHKLYASPFSDAQVDRYIRRRYPFWRWSRRRAARKMAQKIPNLTARPMLLAHIDELVVTNREIRCSVELYEEMINAWLEREKGSVQRVKKSETEKEDLRQFSERLAVDLYINRTTRGAERIQKAELSDLGVKWNIALDEWKLSGRSLLNRDASGNYKFAHRSIMEYLFVKKIFQKDPACWAAEWTDQINLFILEILYCEYSDPKTSTSQDRPAFLSRLDLHQLAKLARAVTAAQKHILTNKAYYSFARSLVTHLVEELLTPIGYNSTYVFERHTSSKRIPLLGGDTTHSEDFRFFGPNTGERILRFFENIDSIRLGEFTLEELEENNTEIEKLELEVEQLKQEKFELERITQEKHLERLTHEELEQTEILERIKQTKLDCEKTIESLKQKEFLAPTPYLRRKKYLEKLTQEKTLANLTKTERLESFKLESLKSNHEKLLARLKHDELLARRNHEKRPEEILAQHNHEKHLKDFDQGKPRLGQKMLRRRRIKQEQFKLGAIWLELEKLHQEGLMPELEALNRDEFQHFKFKLETLKDRETRLSRLIKLRSCLFYWEGKTSSGMKFSLSAVVFEKTTIPYVDVRYVDVDVNNVELLNGLLPLLAETSSKWD